MITPIPKNKGLIRTILVIVVALLIISYLGFNLRELADSPTTQDNFSYAVSFAAKVWNDYLKGPIMYVWNDLFLKLIWQPALEALQNKSSGESAFISDILS